MINAPYIRAIKKMKERAIGLLTMIDHSDDAEAVNGIEINVIKNYKLDGKNVDESVVNCYSTLEKYEMAMDTTRKELFAILTKVNIILLTYFTY